MMLSISGELTKTVYESPLGMVINGGRVSDIFMSIEKSAVLGAGDGCSISGEVFVNGVSCLATRCSISAISGESTQHKTTAIGGDTGIVQAVLDADAVDVSVGDIISATVTVNLTSSPDSQAQRLVLAVMFEPD